MQKSKSKKHIFFLPLMFIGMGLGFLLENWYAHAFVACMFIGMGVGFFLDSFFVVEEKKIRAKKIYKSSSITLTFLGIAFILAGIAYLFKPSLLEMIGDYLIALGFIVVGVYILTKGIESLKK